MMVKILGDVVVSPPLYQGRRLACVFPVSCRLQDGAILCLYRRGQDKHSRDGVLVLQRSGDGGGTWSEPITVHDALGQEQPESVHTGGIVQANDGSIWAMFTTVPGVSPQSYIFSQAGRQLEHTFLVSRSDDGGRTWGKAVRQVLPNTPHLRYINVRPLALPDNDLLVPIEVTMGDGRQAAMIGRYRPSQGVFTPFLPVGEDRTGRLSLGDPKLLRLGDGRILLWLWAFTQATEETVHAHVCLSADEGRTWSEPQPTTRVCQNSALLNLGGGRVILAGNVRVPPEGIRLWLSQDNARTWDSSPPVRLWDAPTQRVLGEPMPPGGEGDRDPSSGKLWESLPGFTFGAPDLVPANASASLLTYYALNEGTAEVRACRFLVG